MRIIGSSKIDDYKKVAIEDAVLKAIDAKPGDSVLFYRKHNDDAVCIYRAEGAKITTEADAPRRRHMREAFVRIRVMLAIAAAFTLLREQLNEVLNTLSERERKVLRLRFGLDDGRARTLEEVGKEFNVTRERIRQIEAKAIRRLRQPSRSRKLKDYLD